MYGRNLKAYQRTNVNAEISVADPYYVTKMLFQGAYERMAQAKGAISLGVIIQPIDNAIRTLMPIKKAWDSIPVSAQQEASSKRTQEQWNVELNNAESMASGHV